MTPTPWSTAALAEPAEPPVRRTVASRVFGGTGQGFVLTLILSSAVGYVLARFEFPGNRVLS